MNENTFISVWNRHRIFAHRLLDAWATPSTDSWFEVIGLFRKIPTCQPEICLSNIKVDVRYGRYFIRKPNRFRSTTAVVRLSNIMSRQLFRTHYFRVAYVARASERRVTAVLEGSQVGLHMRCPPRCTSALMLLKQSSGGVCILHLLWLDFFGHRMCFQTFSLTTDIYIFHSLKPIINHISHFTLSR